MSSRPLNGVAGLAVVAGVAAYLAPANAAVWLADGAWTAAALFAVASLAVARRRIADAEARRPWAYLLVACAFWLTGQIAWDTLQLLGVVLPFPSVADLGWLGFAPVALAGVYRLAPSSPGLKAISALDAISIGIAVGAAVGVVSYTRAGESALPGFGVAVALAYAILHSATAATTAQTFFTRRDLMRRSDLRFLVTGLVAQGIAFTVWAGSLLDGDYVVGSGPVDLLWTAGLVSIGLGAQRAVGAPPVPRMTERDVRVRGAVPILAMVCLTTLQVSFVLGDAPLAERLVNLGALLAITIVFAFRNAFVATEHARLVLAERNATEQAERYFQIVPEMLVTASRDGRFRQVNALFVGRLGYSEAELLERSFLDLVHPDDREATTHELARLRSGASTLGFENRNRRKSGEYIWLLWNACLDPTSGTVYAAAQDITERKQSEAALRESESRFVELVTTIPEVFFIADANGGGTIYVSPAYESIWGRTCESLFESPASWLEAVHPEDRPAVLSGLERVNREGSIEHEFRIVRPGGEIRLVKEVVTVVLDEQGEPTRHVGISSDITDQRELEQELQHSRRLDAIGRLAGGIAHDFNNILTGVAGYTELALARDDVRGGLREDLEEVLGGARRAAELTRQLLTFARRQVVQPRIVDLNDLIVGMNGLLRGAIRENVAVATELSTRLPRVKADPQQLEQVLMNLVLNARDAMPGGGTLTISTEPIGERWVALAVADDGVGMSEQVQSRLFEPFFTTKDVGKGTGLGLATAYGIVEQCGGRIAVDSTPGGGSTFTVVLPVTTEAEEADCCTAQPPGEGGSERILFVEDDDLVRRLTHEMLERDGYQVAVCASPEEALAHEGDWDLLLTDVVMPVLNGPQLAVRLAEMRPPFRVLFTSGYSGDTMIEEGALDPDMPLLQKPFSRVELTRRVREALDGPAGIRIARLTARPSALEV